ncbi:Vps51/Vps67 domain protein [Lasiodiplodia theobromae]|uniref:Conserved oligomeric Golgi complex subunit 1 n=1 Tax=Lasiodiplodia theobromae TaxID=45133 RepID=A0A5N5DW46_9PEZI|nr:Vps51/Vps67 domain protein [Lasiodiplodia theobromae]KAB2581222.1 Conserved oligomeric Golgi complex subunit 1 [Lasiodiplodia theobromae]KAF4541650.1 Vps51/Vps67 domain protein [Lasiodiplodia theobromae]
MATAEAADPRSFNSADDAFQYPVPVVRKLEQQLRHNADENREKLRSLVGASYRDLLGTAERIIEMDRQMQHVESTLGVIGQRCNSRRLDSISKNYRGLAAYSRKLDADRFSFAAQLALLQTCPTVIRRTLKKGSTLLAAKILVISRLLHKNLSDASDVPPFVDSLKNQLASLRRKLLHTVDKQFSRFNSETNDVLESMCAFSLATSSTPSDVLRHFHHVRLESMTRLVDEGRTSQEHLPRALKLYVRTLADTQAIFPKRLADALVRLKARPLLQDPEIQAIAELNLDVHERWIADEVRNFTPWPRHDELSKPDAEKILKAWARQAVKAFLDSTRGVLAEHDDPKTVLHVRRDMLETWLSSSNRGLGVDPSSVLDDLRDVLNERLRTLLTLRASRLRLVTSDLSRILDACTGESENQAVSLWDPSTTSIDTSNGAPAFKRAIIERSHGLNDALLQLIASYDLWASSIEGAYAVIKEMKDTRWDDDLEADDDVDDFEFESKQALLSEDDPRSLEDSLKEALSTAFAELQNDVDSLVAKTLEDSELAAPKTFLIIRALREVSQRLGALSTANRRIVASSTVFPPSVTHPLHLAIARHVSKSPLSVYDSATKKVARSRRARARALWEGNPQLPVQPSVSVFKFLSALHQEMMVCGGDLWSPGAVDVLKKEMSDESVAVLRGCIEAIKNVDGATNGETEKPAKEPADEGESKEEEAVKEENTTNGEKTAETANASNPEVQKDKLTHLLFDVCYLQRAFSQKNSEGSSLTTLEKELQEVSGADGAALERLKKSAGDYWRKSYLLFALLS